jgi:uncharacterized membrane-anchored protein YitT (DUF2179 family)
MNLISQQFVSGGVTGLAFVIYYLLPSLPVSRLYFLLNLPLFALGWMFVGRRFFLYSIGGMLIFSCALQFLKPSTEINTYKILYFTRTGLFARTP